MADYRIPFNRPSMQGNEQTCMAQAVAEGHLSGDGMLTRKCHELLEQIWGARAVRWIRSWILQTGTEYLLWKTMQWANGNGARLPIVPSHCE